ncbi:MAG TPA: hydantoinase/carbamoylase family amidase, partial [Roseiflexaceae bacterium]|nr:hydantoinase/carbamoylase family amidase [Roseiflexaceae bacterium]
MTNPVAEPQPNLERLMADLTTLATFVEPDTPGWTRRFPSDAYLAGRRWLRRRMAEAGLETHIDAVGNLFGMRAGSADLPPILLGSHTDTVLGGGRYDGTLGVLGALEVARALSEAAIPMRYPLLIADFLAEEANDFGVSCVGSRGLVNGLPDEWLARSHAGMTLAEAITAGGGITQKMTAPLGQPGGYAACPEMPIEQGPGLVARGAALGAVSGIVGIRRAIIELEGRPDHAGTAPMDLRHDALAAAAVLILAVEERCRATPGCVGTVGRLDVHPNQSNVVPGRVTLFAEVRSLDISLIAGIWHDILDEARAAADSRSVTLHIATQTDAAPATPPPWLFEQVFSACRIHDPAAIGIPSGAGHDTMHLAHVAPAAMIFVPSIGGRSHCPEEDTTPEQLLTGVAALTS